MTSGFATFDGVHSRTSALDVKPSSSIVWVVAVCTLLMAAVLTYGAVDLWATSVLEISSILLLVGWLAFQGKSVGQQLKWNPLYPPTIVFGVLVGTQIALNLTAYRYVTLLAGLQYVGFCALLFLAVQISGGERASKVFLVTVGSFGFALAIFAICQSLIAPGKLYFVQTPFGGSSVFGPYVNHNHYAGLMEMLTPFALVIGLSKLVHGGLRMLIAFAAILMAGSIVLSGSRSGTFSLIVELAFVFWTASQVRRGARLRYSLLFLVACVLGFLAWLGSGDLWRHLGDLQDATRPAILRDGLRMFWLKPVLGWGFGAFPIAYPAFRSFYTDLVVNAAHNDYLQALVETGTMGFACVVWFIAVLYRQSFKQISGWTHHWDGALRVAALTGCTGLLVHSAFDFNLQIPANAALFCVLCAVATNLSAPGKQRSTGRSVISFRTQGSLEPSKVSD